MSRSRSRSDEWPYLVMLERADDPRRRHARQGPAEERREQAGHGRRQPAKRQQEAEPDGERDHDENDEPARKIGEKHREFSSRRPRRARASAVRRRSSVSDLW